MVEHLPYQFHSLRQLTRSCSVEHYDVSKGTLLLKHNHPPSKEPVVAHVNIDIVLETLKSSSLQVGTWLNIVGYVTKNSVPSTVCRETEEGTSLKPESKVAFVQAIVLWEAVAVKLDAYERAVQDRIWLGTTGF
jgi:hypothetical protein